MSITPNNAPTELNPVLVRLFKKRGFSPDEVKSLLSWDLKDIPNLTQMLDLEKSSHRILSAIEAGERIGIFGDYDVDGCTSCALL